MGMYIYGIIISVIMIIAGFYGLLSGEGSGMQIALIIVGALFFITNLVLIYRAKKGGKL